MTLDRFVTLVRSLRALGGVMVLGGTAHWGGVALRAASEEGLESPVPYLILIGLAQTSGGAAFVAAGGAVARRERAARALTLLASYVTCVYAIAVLPVLVAGAPVLFVIAPVVYVVGAATLAALVLRRAL